MSPIRTSLSHAPAEPASEEQLEAMKRRAWLDSGIVAVRPCELKDDFVRQGLINHANSRWGKRHAHGGSGDENAR